ncbi:hypothetical protein KCP70_00580 [Salmonella enterica subsp. enterica]|nr:hypothetical protein KCP70_00580 [Salmonella enterica subsp. enterica]
MVACHSDHQVHATDWEHKRTQSPRESGHSVSYASDQRHQTPETGWRADNGEDDAETPR